MADELGKLLADATQEVGEQYIHLEIAEGDPVYRERVYCYELYHQMRLKWTLPFVLSGEVDKKGHPIISGLNMGLPIPDFLVHQPGDMAGNHAVIEVKSQSGVKGGAQKDFATLSNFRSKANYDRAIFLVYGMDVSNDIIEAVTSQGMELAKGTGIEFWVHAGPKLPAKLIKIFN